MAIIARAAVDLALRHRRRAMRRALDRLTTRPEAAQEATLRRILAANADTTYGRRHGFARVQSLREFQRAAPIADYEALRPFVERIADGRDPHALTAEPVLMFTSTSGTTSQPKLIPVTRAGRQAERRVSQAWIAHLAGDHPSILDGRWFYLFNRAEEVRTPAGLWVGSNAGLVYRNMPRLLRSLQAVPYEVCLIDDYASRYYVILRHLLACDLSLLVCINPSSILLLAELVQQHAEALIRDIARGGLRDGLALTPEQYAFFRARLPADPARARALARLLAAEGRLLPTQYWPKLRALACWKGPAVDAFIAKCRAWYGDLPIRDVGYGSSEFRSGLVLDDDGSRTLPLADAYVYEFIPADDPAPYLAGERPPLLLGEVEAGGRYLIVQTGPHGLYRYHIEDIVEVNGFVGRTPTLRFVQKARTVTSITGEKLYESQVIEAMERATADRPDLRPSFFLCLADAEAANYKLCAEFDAPRPPSELAELLRRFEAALGEVNVEYPYKRASLRLRAPEIHQLEPGRAVRLIQQLGRQSRMDNQVKIPRLSREVDRFLPLLGLPRELVAPTPAAGKELAAP